MTPMKKHFKSAVLTLSALILTGLSLHAQEPVVGSKDPESLFTSKEQVVMHILRGLLEAGHWVDAPKYLSQRYIQHNPQISSGLQSVMTFFSGRPSTPIPDKNSWKTKVVSVVAEGDLVVVAMPRKPVRRPGSTCGASWTARPTSTGIMEPLPLSPPAGR